MARASRRRSDAVPQFQGAPITHDLLQQLWREGSAGGDQLGVKPSRYRINTARGLRLKTMTVNLRPSWVRRHPEAADWVVKVLPERRTLERDLIAAVAAVEPTYTRTAIGFLDRDKDNAKELQNYIEEWRREYVPYQKFAEKATEDGEFAVVIIPTDVDMEGCPDFYDRLDRMAYDALDDDARAEYELDEDDPKQRYARKDKDGAKRPNPTYDRDRSGKPRDPKRQDFERDDEKSREAHQKAVQRYLLKQEQGGVTVRTIPANDCVPYLVRGTKRQPWKLAALVERTLYWPAELEKQYGWRGMGDRLLVPQGFDATRSTGQNGMFYLYTLYTVWTDPNDPKKVERPLIAYSVGGHPTWTAGDAPADQELPESGVAVIDLYETHGLEGAYWWYGGGLHTSDDDPDYYWEPYLWPLAETIIGIEGMQTSINAATAVSAFTGHYYKPDAALMALDDEALVDSDGELRRPKVPDAGEIETAPGEIVPAQQATVSQDAWRVVQTEMLSLRENTTLEQAGAGAAPSGHAMVVKETIAQTAKRHIREGALDAVRFCGEKALRIFTAIAKEHEVRWPIQTTKERPVGSEVREGGTVLEFDPDWVGDGEYKLTTTYPSEYNPVKVETAMSGAERGFNSPEDVWEAQGITDFETQWSKIIKWRVRNDPSYVQAQVTRLAKRQGDKLMLQVLKLQNEQRMTKGGPPGFEAGVPTAALNGPGGGVSGGPTTAQRSLGGQMAAASGPAMQDAQAQSMVRGAA